jgi:hypothetical protein
VAAAEYGTQITAGLIQENQEDNPNNGTETINSFISQDDGESSDYEDDNNLHLHIGDETPGVRKGKLRISKTAGGPGRSP